jgi:hypothetical protein
MRCVPQHLRWTRTGSCGRAAARQLRTSWPTPTSPFGKARRPCTGRSKDSTHWSTLKGPSEPPDGPSGTPIQPNLRELVIELGTAKVGGRRRGGRRRRGAARRPSSTGEDLDLLCLELGVGQDPWALSSASLLSCDAVSTPDARVLVIYALVAHGYDSERMAAL